MPQIINREHRPVPKLSNESNSASLGGRASDGQAKGAIGGSEKREALFADHPPPIVAGACADATANPRQVTVLFDDMGVKGLTTFLLAVRKGGKRADYYLR